MVTNCTLGLKFTFFRRGFPLLNMNGKNLNRRQNSRATLFFQMLKQPQQTVRSSESLDQSNQSNSKKCELQQNSGAENPEKLSAFEQPEEWNSKRVGVNTELGVIRKEQGKD